jgi:hypothetical protein
MANYATSNSTFGGGAQVAISGVYKTLVNVYASSGTALRRGKIYDVLIGTNGTPADNYMEWDISRFSATAILTATAVTPSPLDSADAAMLGVSTANATTENTYVNAGVGASVFFVGVNQRASYRWVAAPGSELVYAATALVGLGLRSRSGGYTGTATGQLYVQEQ